MDLGECGCQVRHGSLWLSDAMWCRRRQHLVWMSMWEHSGNTTRIKDLWGSHQLWFPAGVNKNRVLCDGSCFYKRWRVRMKMFFLPDVLFCWTLIKKKKVKQLDSICVSSVLKSVKISLWPDPTFDQISPHHLHICSLVSWGSTSIITTFKPLTGTTTGGVMCEHHTKH